MKLTVLLMALTIFAPLGSACGEEKPQGNLIYYSYSYQGSMCRSGEYCRVEADESGQITVQYSDKGKWADIKLYRAPADALEVIEKKVADGRLRWLKSDYKTPFKVLDGWAWSLYIRFRTGSISSGGYMDIPPKAMWDAIKDINAYIASLATEENYIETIKE
ncbi:MAG: hypothetical protein IKH11_01515 [Bacteroidales bacterium]|nr:hypothetical protein [Bacteroidales bacterium]